MIDEWLDLPVLVGAEIEQLRQEGVPVDDLELDRRQLAQLAERERLPAWRALRAKVSDRVLATRAASDPREPSGLSDILATRPAQDAAAGTLPADAVLRDRIAGAWLGRCVGCILGKPVEGLDRARIHRYLAAHDAWPLTHYVPAPDGRSEVVLHPSHPTTTLGNIAFAERDDDIDYAILNLAMRERIGPAWTTGDVAEAWLTNLPFLGVFTAERAVYRNLVNGIPVDQAADVDNPYREWIGAQIRADVWGMTRPGDPTAAAAEAYRDAVLSHRGNGIYGEMMAAAMVATALVSADPREVVRQGLLAIPAESRLARAIRELVDWHAICPTWEECWERVAARWADHHWIHVIPNALALAMGLLYGAGDFERTITITVMGGWDTDSNGATAGAIAGAMVGASGIPPRWAAPLDDRVRSFIPGYDHSRISSLAERTWLIVAGQLDPARPAARAPAAGLPTAG